MFRLLFQPVCPGLNHFDLERGIMQFLRGKIETCRSEKHTFGKVRDAALRNQPCSLHDREYIITGYGECKP